MINIAGSVRRQKPEVKDIEIVALPKVIEVKDMFDAVSYNKGGRILNMLRNYVGEDAFFKSLNN